ncbi:MAG: hypothetical protein D6828_00265 [Nitrospirae bacterium]|nr:MAG: hypothetical protein D6828_00265 [Nitrospirota bacterium]
MKYNRLSFKDAKTYPLKERMNKVDVARFGRPFKRGDTFKTFIDSLPDFLAVSDFSSVVSAIVEARRNGRPFILGMGAHPIKVGLSPIIIDLIQSGIVTAISLNGACIIHDFEIALGGQTSEDVASELISGNFGMAEETGRELNKAINEGVSSGKGLGESVALYIAKSEYKYREYSILASAYNRDIPITVHVGVGTDIIHMHPHADGCMIGEGSLRDFRLLSSVIADLSGGVYLNLGSAVILPEVFLKALNIARNLGYEVDHFTTVNMDFMRHYRPMENVVKRPTIGDSKGYNITGHHEIMFPLLAASIKEGLDRDTIC